jgi:biopolymer transport protein ExbD
MRIPEEPDNPPRLDITSLIDITFSILAFFILSTLFLAQNLGVTVNLPQADTASIQKMVRIVLSIDSTGKMFLNRQAIASGDLETKLTALLQQNRQQEVVLLLQADENLTHGQVVAVIDRLRKIKGLKLAIATTPKN